MVSDATAGQGEERDLETAAVIGAGTMGRQIAALIATSGRTVRLWDADAGMLSAAKERIAEETRTLPGLPRYAHHQFNLAPPPDIDAMVTRIDAAETLADAGGARTS